MTAKVEKLERALTNKTEELARYCYASVSSAAQVREKHMLVVRALTDTLNEKKEVMEQQDRTMQNYTEKSEELGRAFCQEYGIKFERTK